MEFLSTLNGIPIILNPLSILVVAAILTIARQTWTLTASVMVINTKIDYLTETLEDLQSKERDRYDNPKQRKE